MLGFSRICGLGFAEFGLARSVLNPCTEMDGLSPRLGDDEHRGRYLVESVDIEMRTLLEF